MQPPLLERALGLEDLDDCLQLDATALQGLWTPAQWRSELGDPARDTLGLWCGETLVAMASGWLIVDELHVALVAVHPVRRRQGLGRRVLAGLLAAGQRRGAVAATLEVKPSNTAALSLYGSLGFTTRGRRRHYYRDGSDALIQWATFTAPEEPMLETTPAGFG